MPSIIPRQFFFSASLANMHTNCFVKICAPFLCEFPVTKPKKIQWGQLGQFHSKPIGRIPQKPLKKMEGILWGAISLSAEGVGTNPAFFIIFILFIWSFFSPIGFHWQPNTPTQSQGHPA